MVPVPRHAGGAASASGCAALAAPAGNRTRNVVPLPRSLATLIAPLCLRTMPSTAASPRPRPANFVVKKGSKIRAWVSASMPHPVSATSRKT